MPSSITAKGGSVTVSTAEENGQPVLRVADTGIGIPAAEQDRVFERFYRVDKSHSRAIGGTGLGLSIVKHAAAYHHARVALESTLGTGTTVTVTFPPPRRGVRKQNEPLRFCRSGFCTNVGAMRCLAGAACRNE